MDEEDIPCVGVCLPDPDSAYCLGCGRRTAEFPLPAAPLPAAPPAPPTSPESSPATTLPAAP